MTDAAPPPRLHALAQRLLEAAKPDLIGEDARVLVALSGGPDSCALLLALCELADSGFLPRPIGAAHYHHGLRGADANTDAAFAAALCTRLHLPCIVEIGKIAPKDDESLYTAARRIRYEFLIESARDLGANCIATGHNRNDQAETVFGRVLRGASIDGLAGIPAFRVLGEDLCVIRPLLTANRTEIEAYCADREIVPRIDPSNEKDRYTRSRVRKRLPELAREFNPQLTEALVRLGGHARRDADLLGALAEDLWEAVLTKESKEIVRGDSFALHLAALRAAHPALRGRVLIRAIRTALGDSLVVEQAATLAFVERLEALIETPNGGTLDLPGRLRAVCAKECLHFVNVPKIPETRIAFYEIALAIPGVVSVPTLGLRITVTLADANSPPLARIRQSPTVDMAYNAEEMVSASLVLRSASAGDRIAPLGMGGRSRLVRDLLREAGVPAERRGTAPLVVRADTGEIVWVVGVAQAESTRVSDDAAGHIVRLHAEWVFQE